jgi:hypothetical protein
MIPRAERRSGSSDSEVKALEEPGRKMAGPANQPGKRDGAGSLAAHEELKGSEHRNNVKNGDCKRAGCVVMRCGRGRDIEVLRREAAGEAGPRTDRGVWWA